MISLAVVVLVLGAVSAHHNQYHLPLVPTPTNPGYSHPVSFTPIVKTVAAAAPLAVPHYPVSSFTPIVKTASAPLSTYPSHVLKPVAILRHSQDDNFDGTFSYDYQGENGISSRASGYVKAISPKEQAQVMQGEYSYTAPDGTPITTRWYADESGFHAEGAHLPVPPPLPEAIAKSLALQAV